MVAKITRELYDALEHLVHEGLKSFSIQTVPKGEIIRFDPAELDNPFPDIENLIMEFITANDIEPSGTYCLQKLNDHLTIKAAIHCDMVDLYSINEQWDSSDLYECIDELLSEEIGESYDEDLIRVNLDLEIHSVSEPLVSNYQIEYRDDDGELEMDLTKNSQLKSAIVSYCHNWALDNNTTDSLADVVLHLSLEESSLTRFAYSYSLNIVLKEVDS